MPKLKFSVARTATSRKPHRVNRVREAVLLALGFSSAWGAPPAPTALPVPCAPGACGNVGPGAWVSAGKATAIATANSLTINQSSNSAVLNWSSFDIGKDASVTFKQPSSNSVALNKIFQGNPSQIFGKLDANGQVYLINLNGFIFGTTARVNTGSLIASSLPLTLTDDNFSDGILSPLQNSKPTFDATLDPLVPGGRTQVLDLAGNPVLDSTGKPIPVAVAVQEGAQISAASQGRVLLTGQQVTNGGTVTAPNGQVVLAAGTQVFLQADTDPSLRGLVVEVNASPDNKAWNQITGQLSAPGGNITMVGLAVNQDGRINATTSVSANGSVRLEAAQGAQVGGGAGSATVSSSQGGKLTLGASSDIEVLPELDSKATAVADQQQYASSVTLLGEQVVLQGGTIKAPGGTLTVIAAANPAQAAANPALGVTGGDANARLHVDAGVSIDLSGSTTTLPVTTNLVSAQLRSGELADDPTQRDGALHGQTVYVDARDGNPLIANVSGEIAAIPQTIAQRTEQGGQAVFQSEGDLVYAKGAALNVSGGWTTYTGGVMQTSYLVGADGHLYPIATADPSLAYVGVVNPTVTEAYDSWGVQAIRPSPGLSHYEPGYVQGAAAGTVQFAAPNMVLQGALTGTAVNGAHQRTPGTAVAGGQLVIGVPAGINGSGLNPPIDYLAPGVRITSTPTPVVVSDDATLSGSATVDLPVSYLSSSGFTSTRINSNFDVTLPAGQPLRLPEGSTLAVNAARIDLLSDITAPAGTLSFQNQITLGAGSDAASRAGVYVGDGTVFDVRGEWTNDTTFLTVPNQAQTWQNGGSVSFGTVSTGALLSIGNDVSIRASGGAWVDSTGKVTAGTGGAIAINELSINGGLDIGSALHLDAFGVNGAAGGALSIAGPRLEVGNGASFLQAQHVDDRAPAATPQQAEPPKATGGTLQLGTDLYSNAGFGSVALRAVAPLTADSAGSDTLLVDPGTLINATVSSLLLQPGYQSKASAPTLDGVASQGLLPAYQRPSESLTFTAQPPGGIGTPQGVAAAGQVHVGAGAVIATDALGKISLASLGSILVEGTLRAPGGSVSLHITTPDSASADPGFLADQRLELAAGALIDVSGAFVARPSSTGLSLGTAYGGGTISLFADRGAVLTDAGSQLSALGISASLDSLQQSGLYAHAVVNTAGGSIQVRSGESIALLGSISAAGGTGGNTGAAAGGSLEVDLTRSQSWWNSGLYPQTFNPAPLMVDLSATAPSTAPAPPAASNLALLGAQQLAQSGIDSLHVVAGDVIRVSGPVSLDLARSLILDAPAFAASSGAQATLSAPYVEIGNEALSPSSAPVASAGTGALTLKGAEIDLVGALTFQGLSNLNVLSSGDLQLRGTVRGTAADTYQGGISLLGALSLGAARIYPTTAVDYRINAAEDPASGAPGTVSISQTGVNPGTPLSAGAALTINANSITSSGTVYAPFGTIALNALNSLTLADGSLTSVSGAGLTIPYGQTQFGGQQWIYPGFIGDQTVAGVSARPLTLSAPSVTLAARATVDLSGGGDLLANEWVPGSGGTKDVLANGAASGLYAILPSTLGQAAPHDSYLASQSPIAGGQTVYLSGGNGLAAGFYPLLPAQYALLPGALLVRVEPQFQSNTGGALGSLTDGTPVMSGYLSYGSTGLHQTPGYSGFAIYPGSYGNQLAEYDPHLASAFFTDVAATAGQPRPVLPADAGSLTIAVTRALDAQGVVKSGAASGGIAAPIAITANDLVVGDAQGALPADAIHLSTDVLSSWTPGTLLLGGTLVPTAQDADSPTPTLGVEVRANSVTVGAGTLTAQQIVLVANQGIELQSGAQVQSTSATGSTAPAAPPTETVELSGNGAGGAAFLAVSDSHWLQPLRAAGQSGGASLSIDAGATLASRGSLTLDTAGRTQVNGALNGAGAAWSLGSSSIAFVPGGVQSDALDISPALAAQLATAGALRLASTGAIDVLTAVDLGSSSHLSSLTLSAASLNNGAGNAQGANFSADRIVLGGMTGAAPAGAQAGTTGAALTLSASEIDLDAGTLAINGFTATQLNGANVRGTAGGTLSVGGDLGIRTAALTAGSGIDTHLSATGNLTLQAAGATATAPPTLGGSLTLSGDNVTISTALNAASGLVSVSALHDLAFGAGASIDATGRAIGIGNQIAYTPGGAVSLAAGGALTLASGSTVDVSGAAGADAGRVSLASGGAATLGGALKGSATGGADGGIFDLQAGSLVTAGGTSASPLSALAGTLATGGFTQAAAVRVGSGDLALDAGSMLTANAVSLVADSGRVNIAGTVSAPSGAQRGSIAIFGGAGVELQSTGALHADSTADAGRGGMIEIGAGALTADGAGLFSGYTDASITLNAGARISASGSGAMGSLWLRAPALTASNDVAIQLAPGASLAAVLAGAQGVSVGQVVVEPVMVFNTAAAPFSSATAPSVADFQAIGQSVGAFIAAAGPGMQARLGGGSALPLVVQAGVEVVAPGDLTLPALDLAPTAGGLNWRFGGQPVDLTLRAAGNVELTGTLSDGFDSQQVGGTQQPTLLGGTSASLGLVAGADLASANPYASGTRAANLTFDAGAYARTGTGNIQLAASGNIVLAGAGSGAFTAGVPAVAAGASAANPYPDLLPALGTVQLDAGSSYGVGVAIPGSDLVMSLPTAGGALTVHAGQDIVNLSTTAAGAPTTWQLREGAALYPGGGTSPAPATWGVNLAAFNYNFATLGGGDLQITAGRDALNVSAAAAGSLLPHAGSTLELLTSGGLSVNAGRDIGSAQLFLANGRGRVNAGGALSAVLPSVQDATQSVGSAFFLQDSRFDVVSRLGMAVDAVYNPTSLAQISPSGGLLPRILNGSYFTYGDTSSISLQALSGNVSLGQPVAVNETLLGQRQTEASGVGVDVLPASLSVASLQGSITTGGYLNGSALLTLYPSSTGQLNLLAGKDILGGNYSMADARPGSYPTAASPSTGQPIDARTAAFQGNLHVGDGQPALVTAGGDITALSLSVPKPTRVYAGNDVADLTFFGENLSANDLTLISAGRDIVYSNAYTGLGMSVGGPGDFDMLAGRNIALGFSSGVVTSGNLLNANLPTAQGANLTMVTGMGTAADYTGFFGKLVTPTSTYSQTLIDYVQSLQGGSAPSYADAQTAFLALDTNQQRPFIDSVFFNELLLSGRAANASVNPSTGFARGYAAIDALFPGSRDEGSDKYQGDLTLSFSRIYTLSGGNIDLLVPGGLVNVGLANPPATLQTRSPSTLGIVAQGTGDVNIYTRGDVDVNSSRIFTLGGGNILIWSTLGSIDAGKGAKTALSAPPPSVLINADGTVSLNFQGAATGSGIRTIQTNPASPLGSVDLDAPVGTVDAGDAGIGAAGNINIAAQSVIGVSNINFGGTATGVPAVVGGLSASLAGASSAASSTSNTATSAVQNAAADKDTAAPLASTALSWLDVFVTGLGEENCKPDDVDCLKRQKTTH